MIQISYLSKSTRPLAPGDLLALLEQCQKNNAAHGITGVLFYGNGTFLQVVEGEAEDVDRLIANIGRDPRHAEVQLLARKHVEQRDYADWTMGFEAVTDAGLGEIAKLGGRPVAEFTPASLATREDVVDTLMERFRAPHWDPLVRELDAKDKVIAHLRQELVRQRGRASFAMLVVETLAEAARAGAVDEHHLRVSDWALEKLRGG